MVHHLNKKTDLGLLVFLLLITGLLVTKGNLTGFAVAGAITSATELRWSNGTTATLRYDTLSQSYGDPSTVNSNMYLHICADNPAAELQNNYVKLIYRMQTKEINITVLPAQITAGLISGSCADVDLDLDTFSAYYPGIVTVAIDSSLSFSSPTYYQLSQTTGFLQGNYTVRYSQVGSNISINTSEVRDHDGNIITVDLPFMIVGLQNSTGLIHTAITSPGTLIQFPYPADSNISFLVNNYPVPTVYNLDDPEICDNGIDDDGDGYTDCADPECVNAAECQPPAVAPGGGGGGGASYCSQKWTCGEWSKCYANATQTRECIDINDCLNKSQIRNTRLVKNPMPPTTQSCDYIAQCDDAVQNQDETDIDCGGEICIGCENGFHCLLDRDCLSYNCLKDYCRPSGVQCFEDADCPFGFTCEDFECLLFKVFRKPAKLTPLEKYILWLLLLVILALSSYIAYEHYHQSPYHQKIQKYKTKLTLDKKHQILGEFIKQANLKGYTKIQIRKALKEKGWPASITTPYLNKLYQKLPKTKTPKPKPKKDPTLKQEINYFQKELKKLK